MDLFSPSSYLFSSPVQDSHYVINMGNSIIGVSILAMPWCFAEVGIILGTILLVLGGILSRISCNLLLDASTLNRRSAYEYLALVTCGKWAKLAVEISTIGYLLGVCVAFLVTMGDLLPPVASRILDVPESAEFRAILLLLVTISIALPLSLIQRIESLASLSAFSIVFYLLLATKVFLDAFMEKSGKSEACLANIKLWRWEKILILFPIFATGLSCQTQVFVMGDSLSEPTPDRMKSIIADAINICTVLYWSVGFFGYLAFSGSGVKGDILLNLDGSLSSEVLKILYVVTAAISFPLCIFPCRRSVESLLSQSDASMTAVTTLGSIGPNISRSRLTSTILVLATLLASLVIPDIESILNFSGGTMGAMICFILPASIMLRSDAVSAKSLNRNLVGLSWVILLVGLSMLITCLYQVILAAWIAPFWWLLFNTASDEGIS